MINFWLLFSPLFVLKKCGKWQLVITIVSVLGGYINALIMAYRLLADTAAAMSDPTCLWRHPYQEGAVVLIDRFWGKYFIWAAASVSPPITKILQQGVLLPLALFYTTKGHYTAEMLPRDVKAGKAYTFVILLSMTPLFIFMITWIIGFELLVMGGFAMLPIVYLIGFINNRFSIGTFFKLMAYQNRKLKQKVDEGQADPDVLPLFMKEDWVSWELEFGSNLTSVRKNYWKKFKVCFPLWLP